MKHSSNLITVHLNTWRGFAFSLQLPFRSVSDFRDAREGTRKHKPHPSGFVKGQKQHQGARERHRIKHGAHSVCELFLHFNNECWCISRRSRSGVTATAAPHGGGNGSGWVQFPGLPPLCTRHRAGAERTQPTCFCLPPVRVWFSSDTRGYSYRGEWGLYRLPFNASA